MDIKNEIMIKDELLESRESIAYDDQNSALDKIQETKFYPLDDVKDEIDMKDDPLCIKEEVTENVLFEQISGLERQIFINDTGSVENGSEVKNCFESTSQTSVADDQSSDFNYEAMNATTFYNKRRQLSNDDIENIAIDESDESSNESNDEIEFEKQIDFGSDTASDDEVLRLQSVSSRQIPAPTHCSSSVPSSSAAQSTSSNRAPTKKTRQKYVWRHVTSENSSREIPEWEGEPPLIDNVRRPIEYFREFFSNDIIDHIVYQSNLYSTQRNPNKPLGLTKNEFEQFVGVLFCMSLVKVTKTRLYWSSNLQCPIVTEAMSRDRWHEIKVHLHCNDNSEMPEANAPNYDKLYKIRPLITHFQEKFRKIPMTQMLCVDEQIIPFEGRSSLKQFNANKPHKWGFKVFALCDSAGIQYDFEVYDGCIKPVLGEPDLGPSSNIVLHLAKFIPKDKNYLIYFDNWFTSLPLLVNLTKKKIYPLGTVRACRLPGITFPSDSDLIKRGRGSYVELCTYVDNIEIRAVKWADNKCVVLLSSFASAQPLSNVKRYDKKKKEVISVPCPNIVTLYNQFMGGMDLMDSLLGLYRITTRSKKYYHKLIFYMLDVALVNSWLLCRKDERGIGVKESKLTPLQNFKFSVAKSLLQQGKTVFNKKREIPGDSIEQEHARKRSRGHGTKNIPGSEIRLDGIGHLPCNKTTQGRCKNPGCKGQTRWLCEKCNVELCLTVKRNCFKEFHTK